MAKAKKTRRLFEVKPTGDPFSHSWDVSEYQYSFNEDTCTYRGDLSGMFSRDRLIAYLRRTYQGCKIRKS